MSEKQAKIAGHAFTQYLNATPDSPSFHAIKQDALLFGEEAFKK